MVFPEVTSWVEEANDFGGIRRENRGDIASFILIAETTGISQIGFIGSPTVFFSDDVIYLASKSRVSLMDSTVFASVLRTLSNETTKCSRNVSVAHVA